MRGLLNKITALIMASAMVLSLVQLPSYAADSELGNMLGSTTFNSDGTINSRLWSFEVYADTVKKVTVDEEPALMLSDVTQNYSIWRKYAPGGTPGCQYLVSAKVKLVNPGETSTVYFSHNNSSSSKSVNDDTNYDKFYNTTSGAAVSVDSTEWTEVYGIYSMLEADSSQSNSGIHIKLMNTGKKDIYIKDFNMVETGTLDNIFLGHVDPTFENTTVLSTSTAIKPQYNYTSVPEIVADENSDNHYVKLTQYTGTTQAFRLVNIPLAKGKTYKISLDAKLPEDEAAAYKAYINKEIVSVSNFIHNEAPTLSSSEWKTVSSTFTVAESGRGHLNFRVEGMRDGAVYVDNICLKEVSPQPVQILSTTPADGADDVAVTQKLTVSFSGLVEGFDSSNISVSGVAEDSTPVGEVTVVSVNQSQTNACEYEVELSQLANSATYTVQLTGILGVADSSTVSKSFSFKTVSAAEPEPEPENDSNLLKDVNWDFEQEIVSETGSPGYPKLFVENAAAVRVGGTEQLPAVHGDYYAKVTNRSSQNSGIRFNYTPVTDTSTYYRVSAYVRLVSEPANPVTALIRVENFSQNTVKPSPTDGSEVELSAEEWKEVSNVFRLVPKDGATEPYVIRGVHPRIRTNSAGQSSDLLVDCFTVKPYTPDSIAVIQSIPENNSTDVSVNSGVSVTFNNPLSADLTKEQISINNGAEISGITKEQGNTYKISLNNLRYNNSYKLTLNNVTDVYNDTLSGFELSFTTCDRSTGVNLLENTDFEATPIKNWKWGGGGRAEALLGLEASDDTHWYITDADSHSGSRSIVCTGIGDGCQLFYHGIPVKADTDYIFSFYAKASASQSFYMRQGSVSGMPAFEASKITLAENGEWTRYAAVFNSGENTTVRLFGGHKSGTSGTNYYDDFYLAEYPSTMGIVQSTIADGEINVPIDVDTVTFYTTNIIDESERAGIKSKFSIDNGGVISQAEVIPSGDGIELTLGMLKNNTSYTISYDGIKDNYGIMSAEGEIKFTTTPEIIVKAVPEISASAATAVIRNASNSELKSPLLVYTVYGADGAIDYFDVSTFTTVPALTDYTCSISDIPALAEGQCASMYLVTSEDDLTLLTAPVGTRFAFSEEAGNAEGIDPQMDFVTIKGNVAKETDLVIMLLKPLNASANVINVNAYSAYNSENKIPVSSLYKTGHTKLDEENLSEYVYHFAAVTSDENGAYTVTLPLSKSDADTVYGLLSEDDGMNGNIKALYMPSTASYNDAASEIASADADFASILETEAVNLGISLASPVYALRKTNVAEGLAKEFPEGGYSDFTNTGAVKSFKKDFEKILAYYERQEEALEKINSASNAGLKAVLDEYTDVLCEYGGTPLDYNAKYTQYGVVNINQQLIGVGYSSMNEFVQKFNNTTYVQPPASPAPESGNNGGSKGSGGFGGAAPAVITEAMNVSSEKVFSDLSGYEWAEESIINLANRGVINGVGSGRFNPGGNISREQFVKMLILALDIDVSSDFTPFDDVDESAWYAPYVSTAFKNGVIKGINAKQFGVGSDMTRQDMAVMIVRACELKGIALEDSREIEFDDAGEIADYAYEAVSILTSSGIINGVSEKLMAPLALASRAQAAVIFDRIG